MRPDAGLYREWWLSLVGSMYDNHVGDLGVVPIHNDEYPEGMHLATMGYRVAKKEIVAAFATPVARSEVGK